LTWSTAAKAEKVVWGHRGRKLQFLGRQLQISDRGDVDAKNFNFAPEFPQNGGLLSPKFCIFGRK